VFQFGSTMSSAVVGGRPFERRRAAMVIVAGHIDVLPGERDAYLAGCAKVVAQARQAPGCLDFTIGPDLVESGRVNVFERWASQEAVVAFRGSGPSDEQMSVIVSASVVEYDVVTERRLT
jgi:quinol monooxygenase YgiN